VDFVRRRLRSYRGR